MSEHVPGTSPAETVVTDPAWLRCGAWIVSPLLGAGLGSALGFVADWLASTSWAPWQPAFEWLSSLPEPWAMTLTVGVGALAGLGLAVFLAVDGLTVTVAAGGVSVKRRGAVRHIERASVGAVYPEARTLEKRLVVLDDAGAELVRERYEASTARLRAAFVAGGFPWHDTDPHEGRYRMWVPNTPDLDAGANAVFAARQRALDKDKSGDAAALRTELANLGVVVRDERKRQYWRRTSNPSG